MPAAPFPEDSDTAHSVRQHAVVDAQCRWIIADDDAGADALMCGALQEPRRPFCAAHCARAYLKAPPDEPAEGAEAETAVPAQDDQERGEAG